MDTDFNPANFFFFICFIFVLLGLFHYLFLTNQTSKQSLSKQKRRSIHFIRQKTPEGYLYGLFNTRGKVLYVGVTNNPDRRESEHRNRKEFEKLEFKILDEFYEKNREVWYDREREMITHYKSLGQCILNKTNGGNGFREF